MKTRASAFVLAFFLAAPVAHAQGAGSITEGMGGTYKDPVQRAADCYSRGAREKARAEKESDPQKKAKLYAKAKEELSKSIGYYANFDALLALGQVHLALGNKPSALDACVHAQSLKPANQAAKACIDEARQKKEEKPPSSETPPADPSQGRAAA